MNLEAQKKISALVEPYESCSFYAVDPGTARVLDPIYKLAASQNKQTKWYADGWASQNLEYPRHELNEIDAPKSKTSPRHAFFMGQQTDFSACFSALQSAFAASFEIIFVSDHWKDITDSFFSQDSFQTNALPHKLLVPDQYAYDLQFSGFKHKGLDEDQIRQFLQVFLHPGLEDLIEQAQKVETGSDLVQKYDCGSNAIFLPLDPFEPETKNLYGYDWQLVLEMAYTIQSKDYPDNKILVKSHPRQDKAAAQRFIHNKFSDKNMVLVEEQNPAPFLQICSEVWGISSLLLIAALRLGKPIKSLMPNATPEGLKHCNPHLQPYLVTRLEDSY